MRKRGDNTGVPIIRSTVIGSIRRWNVTVSVASLVWFVGCTQSQGPRSAIVEKTEHAGAGDLVKASTGGIEDWFRKHRNVAVDINTMCAPVREKANANWSDSTEGRVCVAAKNAAMSTYRYPSDDKQFHSGWK
jgi:hypothetical protein